MALRARSSGGSAKRSPGDDLLLLHAMVLIAGGESETLRGFVGTLPEWKGVDWPAQIAAARALGAGFASGTESVRALGDIQSAAIRKKAFILAVDVALASGGIDEEKDALLTAMQRVLGVEDALAQKAIEVLALKYAG